MTQNFRLHHTKLVGIRDLYLNKLSRVFLIKVLLDPLDNNIAGMYGTVKLRTACQTARYLLVTWTTLINTHSI